MEWISVKERLPEPLNRRVLMYISAENEIIMGWKGGGSGWMSQMFDDEFYGGKGGYEDSEITHWQPLPDPPIINIDTDVQND